MASAGESSSNTERADTTVSQRNPWKAAVFPRSVISKTPVDSVFSEGIISNKRGISLILVTVEIDTIAPAAEEGRVTRPGGVKAGGGGSDGESWGAPFELRHTDGTRSEARYFIGAASGRRLPQSYCLLNIKPVAAFQVPKHDRDRCCGDTEIPSRIGLVLMLQQSRQLGIEDTNRINTTYGPEQVQFEAGCEMARNATSGTLRTVWIGDSCTVLACLPSCDTEKWPLSVVITLNTLGERLSLSDIRELSNVR